MSKSKTTAPSVDDLAKHARSLLHATSHTTDHKVAEARDKLNEIIEAIGDGVENVEEATVKKAKQAGNYLRKHPYQALGITAGVCALVGLMMMARKK